MLKSHLTGKGSNHRNVSGAIIVTFPLDLNIFSLFIFPATTGNRIRVTSPLSDVCYVSMLTTVTISNDASPRKGCIR